MDLNRDGSRVVVAGRNGMFIRLTNTKNTFLKRIRGRHGCDRMVVGFTTTCAIGAYHY